MTVKLNIITILEFKGMLNTLQGYLDECDVKTQEINPQIEQINFLARMFNELDDKKKLEDKLAQNGELTC